MIAVVDYGAGNVQSVVNALDRIGVHNHLTANPEHVADATGVIVPGVGAAQDTMQNLEAAGLVEPILDFIATGRPYLGICMGMQALMTESEEHGGQKCLGIVDGSARLLEIDLQVPHMGWNAVDYTEIGRQHPLFDGIPDGSDFYFAHSFACFPDGTEWVLGTTDYGIEFPTVVGRDSVMAVQFHPEKSGPNGLRLLWNFSEIVAAHSGRRSTVAARSF
ncbi:MAG: imidazole glycerol phosphate synthase subunit HisH [Thermomicrobiales bacterium]